MISVARAGGTVINYSSRFSLTGMTGTFPPQVIAGVGTVSGTNGPATENNVAQAAPGGAQQAAGAFGTPYTLQTGLTRYAPMQPQPPKTITAKNPTPLWPTSAVQFATTFLPRPSQVTTLTQSGTFSVSSMENTVCLIVFTIRVYANANARLPPQRCPQTICKSFWHGGRIKSVR